MYSKAIWWANTNNCCKRLQIYQWPKMTVIYGRNISRNCLITKKSFPNNLAHSEGLLYLQPVFFNRTWKFIGHIILDASFETQFKWRIMLPLEIDRNWGKLHVASTSSGEIKNDESSGTILSILRMNHSNISWTVVQFLMQEYHCHSSIY